MADPYIGEIRPVSFGFAPPNWLPCDGRLLSINDNQYSPLYTLIGTTDGGDGVNQFALPNLLGRVSVSQGSLAGRTVTAGQVMGRETVVLQAQQVGAHSHTLNSGSPGNTVVPNGAALLADAAGEPPTPPAYGPATALVTMAASSIASAGGAAAHENRQPYLAINFIICIAGVYPSQN